VDNTRFVKQAILQLQGAYRVVWNEGLSLLTIRGTNPEILKREQEGRDILLSQLTRRTAKLVIKD
jgi:aspartate kinase